VQDLDVEKGRLSLKPGEVALDASVAENADVGVGERIRVHLSDGTRATPLVVATYSRGMGLAQVTLPARAALRGETLER
jgi:putative ABC transport system permease protein